MGNADGTTGTIVLMNDSIYKKGEDTYIGKRSVTVKYSFSSDHPQLMSYTVVVNRHVWHTPEKIIKVVTNVPFDPEELHLAAIEGYYKDEYPGLPELTIKIDKGIHWLDGSLIDNSICEEAEYTGG